MLKPKIIYEDENFIAVNKPAGMLTHAIKNKEQAFVPSSGRGRTRDKEEEPALTDWLVDRYPEMRTVGDVPDIRPGIVHRLDRDTSGVMVAAKTQPSFAYLKSLFQKHLIKKTYLAWVRGVPRVRRGTIAAPIGMVAGSTKRSIHSSKMVKEAVTDYVVRKEIEKDGKSFSLLEIAPRTGRTHQIRVHCASAGHPIVGDALYGGRRQKELGRLMLHALALEFPLMGSENPIRVEAELPEGFEDLKLSTPLSLQRKI